MSLPMAEFPGSQKTRSWPRCFVVDGGTWVRLGYKCRVVATAVGPFRQAQRAIYRWERRQ
ncbi:hypothetical protein FHR47_002285 [Xanthomonas arboricola]|nr:hypothetical protein [Xanthomonas cannabis]